MLRKTSYNLITRVKVRATRKREWSSREVVGKAK